MSVVQAARRELPKVPVPRSWKKERIEPTHFICNSFATHGSKGSKGTLDIPAFGSGWRTVRLEKEGYKWAYLIETGTGTKSKVDLETWAVMVKKGRVLSGGEYCDK